MIALTALLPIALWAQDNTWERPEVEEEVKVENTVSRDAKYLKGAVTEENGKVVFTTTIEAPGKTADQIFDIIKT